MSIKIKLILFLFVITFCTGCDQVTKELARQHLQDKEPISYLNGAVRLIYVENTGAALSMGDELTGIPAFTFLILLPLFLLGGILWYFFKYLRTLSTPLLISLACVFAGGVGNLFDRFFNDRHVTDFIIMGIGNLRTGIFNMADVFITVGVIAVLIFGWPKKEKEPQI